MYVSDYVGFIKKVMKQMQDAEKYPQMDKVDVEMEQIEMEGPPPSPGEEIMLDLWHTQITKSSLIQAH